MQKKLFNERKFVNALLYFAKHTNPDQLGSTKLNKLLYHADFLHFKRYGRPITGDRYVKMPYGPVPSTAYAVVTDASKKGLAGEMGKTILDGKIRIRTVKVADKSQSRIEALIDPDLSVFSDSELEVLAEVAKQYKNRSATRLSKDSHSPDAPWSKTQDFQTIEYELSLDASKDSLSKEYIAEWKQEADELREILSA